MTAHRRRVPRSAAERFRRRLCGLARNGASARARLAWPRRHARGLPRRRRCADRRPWPGRPDLARATRRRAPAVARVPPDLAPARSRLAAGWRSCRSPWRRRRSGRRPVRRRGPAQVAKRPRRRDGRRRAPQARRRPRRDRGPRDRRSAAWSSASGSTPTGAPHDFPAELADTMTSLARGRRRSTGRSRRASCHASSTGLAPGIEALRAGRFDAAGWADRQVTTGRIVRLERPDGPETVRAIGVDAHTGALVVADPAAPAGERQVLVGEITHVRLADPVAGRGVTRWPVRH